MRRLFAISVALVSALALTSAPVRPEAGKAGAEYFGIGVARCPKSSLASHDFLVDDETTITFLGTIPAPRGEYWIYYHDHVYRHNYRETRNIILMARGCKYLGGYVVTVDPIGIRGNNIWFDAPKRTGNVIRFSNRTPPAEIWIDGEVHQFYSR